MGEIIEWFVTRNWPQAIQLLKDLFTMVSVTIAGIVAVIGLQTWRKQLRGKTEYDLARNLLINVLKVRDAIKYVRNPFMSTGEITHSMKEQNIDLEPNDPTFEGESIRAVWFTRMKRLLDAFNDLHFFRIEAEALWGTDIENEIKNLDKQIKSLQVAIDLYTRGLVDPTTSYPEAQSRWWAIVSGSDNDDYSSELNKNLNKIEALIKPYLTL